MIIDSHDNKALFGLHVCLDSALPNNNVFKFTLHRFYGYMLLGLGIILGIMCHIMHFILQY